MANTQHRCHAVNCSKEIKPELFMCKVHWSMVPFRLREMIKNTYRVGQCDDKKPSKEYVACVRRAQEKVYLKENPQARRIKEKTHTESFLDIIFQQERY